MEGEKDAIGQRDAASEGINKGEGGAESSIHIEASKRAEGQASGTAGPVWARAGSGGRV